MACGLALALGGCGGRASAPATQADPPGVVTVRMTDFAFSPERIVLTSGAPVRLRLVNLASGGHDFSAPRFFAASHVPMQTIEVPGHRTVEVPLTPGSPGDYPVVCTHPLHELFGMSGSIEVRQAGPAN